MPERPAVSDLVQMARALRRGSAIDAPKPILSVLREFVDDTPDDSPLTMRRLLARDDYRELMTPKVAPGDPAFDFELPLHDFEGGQARPTGGTFRLSAFRGVRPVVLIFGSYT